MHAELPQTAERIATAIKRKHGSSGSGLVPAERVFSVDRVRSNLSKPHEEKDDAPIDGYGLYKSLLSRIPHDVQASFTPEQVRGLRQACEQLRWGRHPLDIRLSLPFPATRFYLVFLAGMERRSTQRLRAEGHGHYGRRFLQLTGIAAAIVAMVVMTI